MRKLILMAAIALLGSVAHANTQNIGYTIEGQEANDMYDNLAKEPKAYADASGNRSVVYVHYEYPGKNTNIRIRTSLTCTPKPSTCTLEGYHLTFVPYKGD